MRLSLVLVESLSWEDYLSLVFCYVCLALVSDGFVITCDECAGTHDFLREARGLAQLFVTRNWIVPLYKASFLCLFALSGLDLSEKWYEVSVILLVTFAVLRWIGGFALLSGGLLSCPLAPAFLLSMVCYRWFYTVSFLAKDGNYIA
jgi:hypothetical protein